MTRRLFPAALVLVLAFEPSPSLALETPSTGTGLAAVSALDRARSNPMEGNPDSTRAGRKLFLRHCVACHGEDGRGSNRGPSLDSHRFREATSGSFFWFLTNGDLRAGMPSWSRLPEAQRWQIAAFLRTMVRPEDAPRPR